MDTTSTNQPTNQTKQPTPQASTVITTDRLDSEPITMTHAAPRSLARTEASAKKMFESLILPHEGSLYAPAMALTRSSSDAEDLVQDTLLRAYDRFETFRADGSPRAWLHTIMRNLFFNSYRKKSREPKQVSLEFFDPAAGSMAGSGTGVSTQVSPQQAAISSPERQVLSQMEGAAVLKAVKALPDEYRQVVALADIQGLPYQEIAETLHIPVGTVRSRLSRGRERVRRAVFAWRPTETPAPGGALSPLPA